MSRTNVLLLGFALLLGACAAPEAADGDTPATPPRPADPDGAYLLVEGSVDGSVVPILEGYRITLTVDGRAVGGTAACNGYGGTLVGELPDVRIEELAHTEMGCEGPVMEAEATFLAGLLRINTLTRTADNLLLSGEGVDLRFAPLPPVPTAALIDTVWKLETLLAGETASSVAGEPATLELRSDGTLIGSTGCRDLSGQYVMSGDEIVFTDFSADGECSTALASQDNHVVTVLGDGFTVQIDGDRLTLLSSGGEGLGYRR